MPSITHVRVRYKDTDTMSVVYYGNYLTYFEVGRVECLRQHGLPMSLVDERIHMPVVEAFVKYIKPARLDDLLEVTSRVSERKRASFRFSYEIRNEGKELVATGYTLHACWDPATSQLIPIPEWLKAVTPDADLDPGAVPALTTTRPAHLRQPSDAYAILTDGPGGIEASRTSQES